jgi:hypothetical protein
MDFYAAKAAYLRHASTSRPTGYNDRWPTGGADVDALLTALGHVLPEPVMDGKREVRVFKVDMQHTLPVPVQTAARERHTMEARAARRNTHYVSATLCYVVTRNALDAARLASPADGGAWGKKKQSDVTEVSVTDVLYPLVAPRPLHVLVDPLPWGERLEWVAVTDLRPNVLAERLSVKESK